MRYFLIIVLFYSLPSWGTDPLDAKVIRAGIYGDGKLFVVLDTDIQEEGCVAPRFDVPVDHPQLDHWLSIALSAAASESLVRIRTHGCLGGYPTMDQTTNSFLYFKKG